MKNVKRVPLLTLNKTTIATLNHLDMYRSKGGTQGPGTKEPMTQESDPNTNCPSATKRPQNSCLCVDIVSDAC